MIIHPKLYPCIVSLCLILSFPLEGSSKAHNVSQQLFQKDSMIIAKADAESDVTFLIGLSQRIIKDKNRLKGLELDSARLDPVFKKAAIQFNRIDIRYDSLKNAPDSGNTLAIVEQEWEKQEDRLEYMLKRRRTIHQQLRILRRKIDKEQQAFALAMKGKAAMVMEITEQNVLSQQPATISLDSANASDTTLYEEDITFEQVNTEYNWRIVDAERELETLKAEFQVAKKTWFLVEQLLTINQDDYATTLSLTESSRDQLSHWKETIDALETKLIELQQSDSTEQLQRVIQDRIDQTKAFISTVESDLSKDSTMALGLQARIDNLTEMKAPLAKAVANATQKITTKNRWLEYLRSPLAPHSVYSFIVNKGPSILIIILLLFFVWAAARWLTGRILNGLSRSRFKSREDRKERIDTLSRAIRSGLTVIMLFVGFLAILSELGIDVSVLLGGAAVFSLAIAIGAQSLVKDFFTGFMILSENQYRVGNVVKINNLSGVVEDISLRTTILRDLEGIAHFIPHGEITAVSNLTHRWSRVALDIGVAYKENVDQVMEVIMEVARGLQEDPNFKKLITDEPEMLGVDALADSAVIIKVLIKTKPTKQWLVKREFLRRMKNRFDELDIEIPFPHRTVYHRDLAIRELENLKVTQANSSDSVEK